ncbi:MAG: glycosyltransferase family 39 protein [Clostridia bacterium]|nr:glycosyltransferase family 39 protein [Clostridia bacterium]
MNSKRLSILTVGLMFFAAVGLIAITRVQPSADQQYVLDAARAINQGELDDLMLGGYLSNNPHQLGLTLIFQLCNLIAGTGADVFLIQGLNAIAIAVSVYGLYKLTELLFQDKAVSILFLALIFCFPQLTLYVTFVYGNAMSLSLSLLATLYAIKYLRKRRIRHGLLSVLLVAFAAVIRQNNLIVIAAIAIVYFIDAVWGHRAAVPTPKKAEQAEPSAEPPSKKSKAAYSRRFCQPRLNSWLILVLTVSISPILQWGITSCYENLAQRKLDESIPSIMYIAMGLQDGGLAPGWWNGYVPGEFVAQYWGAEPSSRAAKKSIEQSLEHFYKDPAYAVNFFYQKTASMWINPTFQSFWISTALRESAITNTAFAQNLYHGNLNHFLTGLMNIIQSLVLCGVVAYCVFAFIYRRCHLFELLPPLIFIGGFLFHLVWEAKGQYALPYFVLLLPYAAYGLLKLASSCSVFIKKLSESSLCKKP